MAKVNKLKKAQEQIAKAKVLRHQAIRNSYLKNPSEPIKDILVRVANEFDTTPATLKVMVHRAKGKGDDWNLLLKQQLTTAIVKDAEDGVIAKKDIVTDVGYKDMVVELKSFSYLALKTSKKLVENSVIMIDYYCEQVKHMLSMAGDPDSMSKAQKDILNQYQSHIDSHYKKISSMLQPQAVSSYMRLIGVDEAAKSDLDDIDKEAFTIDKLQAKLKEMGMMSVMDNQEGTKAFVDKYKDEVPDIEGFR